MATEPKTRYTYADLERFAEDNLRREIIDGELIVTAAPATRHQQVVMTLAGELYQYVKSHGGKVFPAPTDVFFSDTNVVEPDVLFVRAEHASKVEKNFVRAAPDVVVEVSSPSTRRFELIRKRELYERFGVPEYWYVDLEPDRVEVYRLHEGIYGPPRLLLRGDVLESPEVPGFALAVEDLLGPPEHG
ncbi:Uma2 family endonuclease [soil metagenome]|nr:Uma2 family endonuclease [Actinomycetota bacterium]